MIMSNTRKKIIATIECRMTSSRLPGKVMLETCGKPMIAHLVERLERVDIIDEIVIATTTNITDDIIVELAESLNIKSYRGSENDVLKRVLEASQSVQGDVIVEITGDCPLIDPDITHDTIDMYLNNSCDYASNCIEQTFPIGTEVEVFSNSLLEIADKDGTKPLDREHVSWYFIDNPDKFTLLNMRAPAELNYPEFRLTLDEKKDFELIDTIYRRLYPEDPRFSTRDVISLLRSNPVLVEMNQGIKDTGSWDALSNQ